MAEPSGTSSQAHNTGRNGEVQDAVMKDQSKPHDPKQSGQRDEEEPQVEVEQEDGRAGGSYGYMFDESDEGSSDSLGMDTWIRSYCSLVGHEFFAEVAEDFIEDDFNLTGLSSIVPHYREALELILDLEPENPLKIASIPLVESSAELLYGMIHARYILSRQGLQVMAQKYQYQHFGTCPRYLCNGTSLLPVGRHDMPGFETVRLYCPCCMDIYVPPNSRYLNIDGAFFGTSFPGLFLKTFPDIEESISRRRWGQFHLRIFGFKISEHSKSGSRMKWLRQKPTDLKELDTVDDPAGVDHVMESDKEQTRQGSQNDNERMMDGHNDNESMMSISMNGES